MLIPFLDQRPMLRVFILVAILISALFTLMSFALGETVGGNILFTLLLIGLGIVWPYVKFKETYLGAVMKYIETTDPKDRILYKTIAIYKGHGKGMLFVTERRLIYVSPSKEVFSIHLATVIRYGTDSEGTGAFVNRTGPSISNIQTSVTSEVKQGFFYVEYEENGNQYYSKYLAPRANKIFKKVERNLEHGIVAEEIKRENARNLQIKNSNEREAAAMQVQMERIVSTADIEMNELEVFFLQNGNTMMETRYDLLKDYEPRFHAIPDDIEKQLVNFLVLYPFIRGYRMALIALSERGVDFSGLRGVIIPDERTEEYSSIELPPAKPTEIVSYKTLKTLKIVDENMFGLSEKDALMVIEVAVELGYRNTMLNYKGMLNCQDLAIGNASV